MFSAPCNVPRSMFELLITGSMIRKNLSPQERAESRQAQEYDPKAGHAATSVSVYKAGSV